MTRLVCGCGAELWIGPWPCPVSERLAGYFTADHERHGGTVTSKPVRTRKVTA